VHYSYLIIGGGMTAAAAVQGIREIDSNNPIGLIGAEAQPPYKRPLLSKALWKGEPFAQVWIDIELQDVELFLGRQAQVLDAAGKQVTDDQGTVYTFDKLLLATGGTPRRFPWGSDQIIYYRTLADYRWLRSLTEEGQRFAVIGGGFTGSEIAAALAMNNKYVVMLFPETKISERICGPDLSQFLNNYYGQHQVELLAGERAIGVERRGAQVVLTTQQGMALLVDGVIAGIGIEPNTELAQAAGLKVENGIVVDELLRTSHPDIYAAGDVANFYNVALGKRLRVEHEDNAITMGKQVGRAMAGQATPYTHLPFFYSDLFDLGYEAVGSWTRAWRSWRTGKNPSARGCCTICMISACEASFCGTFGGRWMQRGG